MKTEQKQEIRLGFNIYLKPIKKKFINKENYKDYEIVNKELKK